MTEDACLDMMIKASADDCRLGIQQMIEPQQKIGASADDWGLGT